MPSRFRSTNELRRRGKVAVDNTLSHPHLQSKMSEFSYGPERVQELRAQGEEVERLIREYDRERGDAAGASTRRIELREEVERLYRLDRRLALVGLRDDADGMQTLGLHGAEVDSYADLIADALKLYTGALENPPILEKLARVGLHGGRLESNLARVRHLQEADDAYNAEFGEAKMARARLDEALAAYGRALRDFLEVAEVAFADDPAALALLGLA